MKRNGFTIWELFAVIIIILVMVVLLFPSSYEDHKRPQQFSCESNMKQLGLGILQYAQDNDDNLPDIATGSGNKHTWRNAIRTYARDRNMYQCPSRDDKDNGPDGFPLSYAANSAGVIYKGKNDKGNGAFAGSGSMPVETADIPNTGSLIMLCEITGSDQPDFNIDNVAAFNPQSRVLWDGHEDGSNYLFADGHVKTLHPLDTKGFWHRDASIPLTPNAVAILQKTYDRAGK